MKLIDFGSAIYRKQQETERFIFGTPAFCAPEMKTKGELTERTDIYCMGKCMEYMLFHTPKPPKGYRNIVEQCLRKKEKEYESAEQVRRELEKLRYKKRKERAREVWYAVTGPLSEQDGSMAALQLAMYLRDRYKKPVLYLDCTEGRWMEHLEQSEQKQRNKEEHKNFAFERNGITVVKRVAPQEISSWCNRGYVYIVACLGKHSPLISECPFRLRLCAGAVTEFNLNQWKELLLPLRGAGKTAVALTGGDYSLANREFGRWFHIKKLSAYFRFFEQSKPFRRDMKKILDGR